MVDNQRQPGHAKEDPRGYEEAVPIWVIFAWIAIWKEERIWGFYKIKFSLSRVYKTDVIRMRSFLKRGLYFFKVFSLCTTEPLFLNHFLEVLF